MWRNFWNPFTLVLYFYNFWPELQMATITPGDRIFDWKLVVIVFTTCGIEILGLILNLRAMGLTYSVLVKIKKVLKFSPGLENKIILFMSKIEHLIHTSKLLRFGIWLLTSGKKFIVVSAFILVFIFYKQNLSAEACFFQQMLRHRYFFPEVKSQIPDLKTLV